MAKDTDLTRKEYTREANKWVKENPKAWKVIRENSRYPFTVLQEKILTPLFGKPKWQDHPKVDGKVNPKTGTLPTKDNKGEDFTIENKGSGKIGYKSAATRKVTRGNLKGGTRDVNEQISTPKQTPAEKLKFGKAMRDARKLGMEGDHNIPVGRTGAALRPMTPRRRQQYLRRMLRANQFTGNQAQNITPRTGKVNRDRNVEFNKLDAALKELSKQKSDPFGLSKKAKTLKMSAKTSGKTIQTDSGKPTVQIGLNMNDLAPLSRTHVIPGGRVVPIKYI